MFRARCCIILLECVRGARERVFVITQGFAALTLGYSYYAPSGLNAMDALDEYTGDSCATGAMECLTNRGHPKIH